MNRRGLGLGSTLLVTALVVTLGFGLSGLSVSQLNRTRLAENRQRALNLADSAVALALTRLKADPRFGVTPATIEIPGGGSLTFDPTAAHQQNLTLSFNNLENLRSTQDPQGTTVPSSAVRLVAEGRCNGVTRKVEVILHAPPFPYAAACAGRIDVAGRVLFAGVDSAAAAPLALVRPEEALPADIGANAPIDLEGDIIVTGDARTAESIAAGDGVQILGRRRENTEPIRLPDVPLADFDPAATGQPYVNLTTEPPTDPTLTGRHRYRGNLTIDGDLTLDTGLLFVEGDLHVTGGVKGKGGLVATGLMTVDKACALDSGHRLALLAGGDVRLTGTPGTPSYLQGIVYTRGRFSAERVTVVGSVIARGESAGELRVQDGAVLKCPEYAVIQVGSTPPSEDNTLTMVAFPSGQRSRQFQFTISAPDPTHLTFTKGDRAFTVDLQDRDPVYLETVVRQAIRRQLGVDHLTEYDVPSTGQRLTTEGNCEFLVSFYDDFMADLPPEDGGEPIISFDPSQFLRPEDRLQVALWRVLH